jgi:opacity protein-like surface antigen
VSNAGLDLNVRVKAGVSYAFADGEAAVELLGTEIANVDYELQVLSATLGVELDLWPLGPVVPYVGAGLGYAMVENEVGDADGDQSALSAYGEGGVPLILSPQLALVPSFRLSWTGTDEDDDEVIGENLLNTQLRLGLRYSF